VKILWHINIQTDHVIEHGRPDITVVDMDKQTVLLIDIAMPREARVDEKEQEKIDLYQDLAVKLRRLWKVKTKVIPIVV